MEQTPEEIETVLINLIKRTVGYSEILDKNAFMVGATVALSKAYAFYENEIHKLKVQVSHYKEAHKGTDTDIRALTRIIKKYSE